jgi:SAM-dependent methyltransferase
MKPPAAPDPTQRFSDRVADYVRYRPSYPPAMFERIRDAAGLGPGSVVADLGSGTGISTEPFLRLGCTVHAVEPNDAMRAAAEELLSGHPGFRSVAGTAEATTLPDRSVDLVAAGQAFHWFRPDPARVEIGRILRPGGRVALFWNRRREDTAFGEAYETLLRRYGTDYSAVDHRNVGEVALDRVFAPGRERVPFENAQELGLEAMTGRLMSASYAPAKDHPDHAPMIRGLEEIFRAHQRDGIVRVEYETVLFLGGVSES